MKDKDITHPQRKKHPKRPRHKGAQFCSLCKLPVRNMDNHMQKMHYALWLQQYTNKGIKS